MASSLLTLLDDIATLLDDVAVMTKVAAKKTAGVLGDDLALNAQQVSGVNASRELPVVWAVAKGSAVNKLILVPAALLISYFAPWLITPLLMLGGAFLCFEGVEKIAHALMHNPAAPAQEAQPELDAASLERSKIKGAIRTDFVLSAEIIVIALGTVASASFASQASVLVSISVLMTVGVYGLVAGIVKLDDAGLYLTQQPSRAARAVGTALLWFAPKLMKTLSVVGTAAMFMVGGGILMHGFAWLNAQVIYLTNQLHYTLQGIAATSLEALLGVVVGAVLLAGFKAAQALLKK